LPRPAARLPLGVEFQMPDMRGKVGGCLAGIVGGLLGCFVGGCIAMPPPKPQTGNVLVDMLPNFNGFDAFVAMVVVGGVLGVIGGAVLGARFFGGPRPS